MEKSPEMRTIKCFGDQKHVHKDVTIKPQLRAISLPSISVALSKKNFLEGAHQFKKLFAISSLSCYLSIKSAVLTSRNPFEAEVLYCVFSPY